MRAGGKRAVIVVSTSRFAAASFPVTSPILRGSRGSGRFRSAANTPSAASFAFSRSIAARCCPIPKRSIDSARRRKSPRASNSSGRPNTCTRSPSVSSSRSASKRPRGIETGRHAPSSGSLSVKNTEAQRSCRRSSVTSPSTQTVGSRASHEATPRLKDATEKTLRSPYSTASTFTAQMLRGVIAQSLDPFREKWVDDVVPSVALLHVGRGHEAAQGLEGRGLVEVEAFEHACAERRAVPGENSPQRLLLGGAEAAPVRIELRAQLGERRLMCPAPVLERRRRAFVDLLPEPVREQDGALRMPRRGLEQRVDGLAGAAARSPEAVDHERGDVLAPQPLEPHRDGGAVERPLLVLEQLLHHPRLRTGEDVGRDLALVLDVTPQEGIHRLHLGDVLELVEDDQRPRAAAVREPDGEVE